MKKTFLALALSAATVPFTFAAQSTPPAQGSSSSASKTTKSHKKGAKKSAKKAGSTATTPGK